MPKGLPDSSSSDNDESKDNDSNGLSNDSHRLVKRKRGRSIPTDERNGRKTARQSDDVEVKLDPTIASIGHWAFWGWTSLRRITIPSNITSIGDCAFSGCSSLTAINMPPSITSIGDCAFSGCSSLTMIDMPHSITTIKSGTFEGCSSLKAIDLPSSITTIGKAAFLNCSSLSTVILPPNLMSIRSGIFRHCKSLVSVRFNADPMYISISMFRGCDELITISAPSFSTNGFNKDSGIFREVLVGAGFSPYDPTLKQILHDAGPAAALYPKLFPNYVSDNNDDDFYTNGNDKHKKDHYYNFGLWARTRSVNESRLPLCNAAVRSLEWKSVQRIFDANMLAIQEPDIFTGLPMFMLAAVGSNSKFESTYNLLRKYPPAMLV